MFMQRFKLYEQELHELYTEVYGSNEYYNVEESYEKFIKVMEQYELTRPDLYKNSDENHPHWYMNNDVVGMMLYVDLFSGDLAKFHQYIPYFKELGITFIHFMPILEGREGENDGGYAVADYKNIDPKFGTMKEFDALVAAMKEAGIHTCIDFVVNHTAKEHEFARKALAGNQVYQDLYLMYDTDVIPRKFDETVPEVFPGVSPGNFTYYKEIDKWVFTSFYEFQWDLNYQNPLVLEKIVDILLYLANLGVDMIRLDAIPFMWKEIGTTCRNHPMIHKLLRIIRLVTEIVCPSVALLGEAIVEPEEIVKYFGEVKTECDVMYNATHMVNIWNAIATRDTRLLQIDGNRLRIPRRGCWINYARCHDDIGWGFNEDAIKHMGMDPYMHKQFLINFYRGAFEGSFSVGDLYEYHEETGDARNCGTLASLVGLEKALANKDQYQQALAIKRINMIHSLLMASAGLPLLYSGDEIAQLNDYNYFKDPHKAHDSRWLHRGFFNHDHASMRNDGGTTQSQVFGTLKRLIEIRKSDSIFAPTIRQEVLDVQNHHIYCLVKNDQGKQLVCLFNFSEHEQFIQRDAFLTKDIFDEKVDMISGKTVDFNQPQLLLGPYEYLLLI